MPAVDLSGSHYAYLSPVCAALALVSLLLVGLLAWNVREARAIRAQAMVVERALARVQEEDRQVQLRAQTEGVDLSDPAMGRLTAQVVFANDLIAKRAFSWTRILSDLEETVPPRVSINSIRLDFKDAGIAIGGSALSLKDLTTFIISLEDHRAFKDAHLLQHRVSNSRTSADCVVRPMAPSFFGSPWLACWALLWSWSVCSWWRTPKTVLPGPKLSGWRRDSGSPNALTPSKPGGI